MQSIIQPNLLYRIAISVLVFGFLTNFSFADLTLVEAEKLVMGKDPVVAKLLAESKALSQNAIADGELKDPRLKLGITAIPLDSFDLKQEGMTQQQIGIQQMFPRGDSLRLKKEQTYSSGQEKRLQADLENMKTLRDLRIAFLEVIYRRMAYRTVLKSKQFFKQLVEISEFRFASGKTQRQRVLEAAVALSRMDDRLLRIKHKEDLARARLSRWIPRAIAFGGFPATFPKLSPLPERSKMTHRLLRHPSIQLANTQIQTRKLGLLQAKEQYKPGWMLDATYGRRGGKNPNGRSRSDFLSFMVSADLPLFSKNRQDRVQNARQTQVQAAEFGRDDQLRNLETALETNYADFSRFGERKRIFKSKLLPESKQYTETSMISYQSRVADLTDVIRGHLSELTTRLDLLEVQFKRLVAHTKLLFVIGDRE